MRWMSIMLAIGVIGCAANADRPADGPPMSALFYGHDLAGWKLPNPYWKVVDGVLVGDASASTRDAGLYKERSYKVWLNGQQALDLNIAKYPQPGPIGLQLHFGAKNEIEFRNMNVRELKAI